MALSNVEKKVGVTVTVDATGALKAWKEYQRAQEQAKKSTEDMAKQHGVATKEMAAAIKHQEKLEKEAARARKQATQEFKQRTDDNLAAIGRFTAGVGIAAIALDKASQRQLEFANLSRNLRISIDAARESTAGMVSNLDLMRQASMATSFGVVKTDEEFAQLAATAQKLGARIGKDTTEAIGDLTLAISRQSPMILDNLGITLKISEAHAIYAKQLGKTVSQLTEAEKREAFRVAALQKAKEATEGVTVATRGSAAEVQRFKATMSNALDTTLGWGASLGNDVVGGMSSFVNTVSLGTAGTTAFERAQADAMAVQDEYTKAVDRNAKALKNWIHETETAAIRAATLGATLQGILTTVNIEADRLSKVGFFQAQTEQRIAGQVHQLDLEEAKLRLIGGAEQDIVAVQDQKRALLMEEAALRGDILKVIELTRQEELAAVGAPRRGGGGGDRFASQRAAFEAELAGSQRAQGFSAMNRDDQTARGEFGEQLGIAQRNQAIAEAQAQHNAIMEAGEQEHLRKMEEARKAAHEANLKRIAAEKKAREDALRHQQAVQRVVSSLMHDSMGLAEEVAIATASSQRTATLIQQGFAASRATVTGIEQTVLAAAAFASLNPVQGALHAGAAALAYAKAGLLAGGVIGPGAGSSGGGGGGGSSSFGGGGSSGGGSRSASGQSAPISRKGEQHASPAAASGGGGFNGTIIFQSVLPADEEKAGHKIRQLLQHSGETFGSN